MADRFRHCGPYSSRYPVFFDNCLPNCSLLPKTLTRYHKHLFWRFMTTSLNADGHIGDFAGCSFRALQYGQGRRPEGWQDL